MDKNSTCFQTSYAFGSQEVNELCDPVNGLWACVSQKQKSVSFTIKKHFFNSKQILLLGDNS